MAFTEQDALRCRADFPALRRPLAYLDGPAGTQVPRGVIDAMARIHEWSNANSGGRFVTSRETDELIQASRDAVACFLGAEPGATISFGASMTTLTFSLAHALGRDYRPGDEIVVTALDHEANRGPWYMLEERGVVVREVSLNPDGRLDEASLRSSITERTRLVALGMASNALGTVNDFALARALSNEVGAELLLDAVHYAPHFPIDVRAIGCDYLLCSAYKFYGPHVGILYCRPGRLDELRTDRLSTQKQSGPERIETGTLNHAALAGVRAAIEYIAALGHGEDPRSRLVDAMDSLAGYEHGLGRTYHDAVRELPGVTAHGLDFDSGPRTPTVSITLDGASPAAAAEHLGDAGVLVWHGDFYAARPVQLLGLEERGGLIRVGISLYNTRDEIARLLQGVGELTRVSSR